MNGNQIYIRTAAYYFAGLAQQNNMLPFLH